MTIREGRYHAEYAKSHNYKPQLSVGFDYVFTDSFGVEHRATMLTMKTEVEENRKLAKVQKLREAKYGVRKTAQI